MDASLAREPRRLAVRLSDGEMSVLEFGDPQRPVDVVWVHANGFNAQTYRHALSPLASGLRIWAPDLRGHGESTLPADPRTHRSWRIYARDLGVLLQGLEGRAPVLAGHSMGATAALFAAAAHPGRARSLVLFDPVIAPRAPIPFAWAPWRRWAVRRSPLVKGAEGRRARFGSLETVLSAYRGRGAFKTWPETVLADYVAGGFRPTGDGDAVELRCPPAWEAANFRAFAGLDPWRALKSVRAPARILRAERASTCRLTEADALLRRRPAIRVETVPDATHFIPMERPDLVREALLDAAGG